MSAKYIAARLYKAFATEVEALRDIENNVIAADNSRPPEKRFEVELFRKAVVTRLANGEKCLVFGENIYVVVLDKEARAHVFVGGTSTCYESLDTAREWIQEFQNIGLAGGWKLFHA